MANNGNSKIAMYAISVLVTLVLFIALPTMAKHIIENDKASRARDTELGRSIQVAQEKITDKLDRIVESLSDLKSSQVEIRTEQRYIKELVRGSEP